MNRMPLPGRSMPSQPPPPSAGPPDMGAPDDEAGETCTATITSDQLNELQTNGTLTVQADSGETVQLTLSDGQDAGAPDADSMNGDSATTA